MVWEKAASFLRCPVCNAELKYVHNALVCQRGHSFDIAREGYVNFLLTNRQSLRRRGDSKEMLLARRSFLERGHYRPLADALSMLITPHLTDTVRDGVAVDRCGILDVGCGEGYYLDELRDHFNHDGQFTGLNYLGTDIAKEAVRLAAKRRQEMHFAVADINASLPFADQSICALLNIFAPHHPRDFARILASTGVLVVVIPTPNHVSHLRAALPLLGIEKDKLQRTIARFSGFFEIVEIETIEYEVDLSNDEIFSLVRMTPNERHLTPAAIDLMRKMEGIRTAVGFNILLFHKVLR